MVYLRSLIILSFPLLGLISCNTEKDFSNKPHVIYEIQSTTEKSLEILHSRLKSIEGLEFQLVKSKSTSPILLNIYDYFPLDMMNDLIQSNGKLKMVFPNDEMIEFSDADTIRKSFGMNGMEIAILLSVKHAKELESLSSKYINQKVSFQFNNREFFAPVITNTLSKAVVIHGNDDFSTEMILAVLQHPLPNLNEIQIDSIHLKLLNHPGPNANLALVHDSLHQKHLLLRDSLMSVLGVVEPRYDQYHDLMEILMMVQNQPLSDLCMKHKLDLQTLQLFQYDLAKKLPEVRKAAQIKETIMEINNLLNLQNSH